MSCQKLKSLDILNNTYNNLNLKHKSKNKNSFKAFLEENEKKVISFVVFFLWFCANFISIGVLFLLPKHFEILDKKDKAEAFKSIILTIYFFIPSPLIRGFISESNLFGRKFSISLSLLFSVIFSLISCFDENNLSVYLGLSSFFINVCFGILLVYTAEYFDTKLRPYAIAIGNLLGRLGGLLAPFAFQFFDAKVKNGSLIVISFISAVCFAFSLLLRETRELKIR